MNLSPIVLFVYNRPWHTEQTLAALSQNELADQSELYIFADGPKADATKEAKEKVKEVRQIIRKNNWCKTVHIIESINNKGLASSIIEGVTTIVNKYGKVIVLEDDIVTSTGFLKYMNKALDLYENEESVFHISGYMYPHWESLPDTFFFNVPLCWGWATWQRSWRFFRNDDQQLVNYFDTNSNWGDFNLFGGNYLENQLRGNVSGRLKTWFIKWHASVMVQNGFCLFPGRSLVDNIGFDNSGIHNETTETFSHPSLAAYIPVSKIPFQQSVLAEKIIKIFYLQLSEISKSQNENWAFVKSSPIAMALKKLLNKIVRWSFPELQIFKSNLLNHPLLKSEEINIVLGKETKIYKPFNLNNSQIGNYTYVAPNSSISEAVIGKFCSIGTNFLCGRGIHPTTGISTSPMFYSTAKQNGTTLSLTDKVEERKPIIIGNDVYIGANVIVLDGVTIGDGAVIGAGAVVSRDIPPYAIAVGCPIQVIRYRFNTEQIEQLLKIKWWNFKEQNLQNVEKHFFDIDEFIKLYRNV